jgi:membrane-anchored glycerophosphoryl diester phosphodiesterase (GDPDase)
MVVRLFFALPALIQANKSVGETYLLAKSLTRGAWWFTALMWGLFVIMLYAINVGISIISSLDPIILVDAATRQDVVTLTDLLAFLLSLFIFGPITTAFQYLLMLQTAKNQSVKL